MSVNPNVTKLICTILSVLFFAIGVLNSIMVHPVPGILYLIVALLYFPTVGSWIKKKWKLSIPFIVKVAIALLILWATLAVGDLMEIFEAKYL